MNSEALPACVERWIGGRLGSEDRPVELQAGPEIHAQPIPRVNRGMAVPFKEPAAVDISRLLRQRATGQSEERQQRQTDRG